MFKGKKCTDRCLNSISILQRQKAAKKLENCFCTGNEDFDCEDIKTNMQDLCFEQDIFEENAIDLDEKPVKKSNSGIDLKISSHVIVFMACLILNFI